MKKLLLILITLVLVLPSVAILAASDIADAVYLSRIIAINSASSSKSNVWGILDLSTEGMIASGMLNATATDAAARASGGDDIAFGPSVNSSYPWCFAVPDIGAYSQADIYLYTSEVTGGKIRYFPDTTGMAVSNNNTNLQPSSNFTISMSGFINIDAGNNKNLISKDAAIKIFVSPDSSGNITASISNTWVAPEGHVDEDAWENETNGYDTYTGTATTAESGANTYTGYLDFTHSAILIDCLRCYNEASTSGMKVDIYYGGAWHNVYEDDPATGWQIVPIPGIRTVTAARIAIKRPTADTKAFYELQFGLAASISATIDSNEHKITIASTPSGVTDFYEIGADNSISVYSNNWGVQTFTPTMTYQVSSVSLYSLAQGSPGTATLSIRFSSGGLPTGSDLISKNENASLWAGSYSWNTFTFSSSITLAAGTQYAIIIKVPSGNASNDVQVRSDASSPNYTGGTAVRSTNGGTSWTAYPDTDCYFRVSSGTQSFRIYIDDVLSQSLSGAYSVPNPSTNWAFCQNNAMPYMEYAEIRINGQQRGYWSWQYSEYFLDQSGNGNTATPTFRTASSDADVNLSLYSQTSLIPSTTPTGKSEWVSLVQGNIKTQPAGLYTEGGTTYPGGTEVNQLATDTRVPYMVWAIIIAVGSSIAGGLFIYKMMSNPRRNVQGSAFTFWLTTVIIYAVWGGVWSVVPLWPLIPYSLVSWFIILWLKPYNTQAG